ncbi:MAG: AAA family ATPase [Oceanospirillaceae bacterium]|nr:AAA family ATPase [Oceanospirillaceae bacterium]
MTKSSQNHTKKIKPLIQNAEKGILRSQLQLHEYYAEGKYVDKNEELSQKYYQQLEKNLIGKKIRLKSFELTEFRRFKKLNIDFSDSITVIIGDNGAGKTSIAEAIAKVFSWFNHNLVRADVNGNFLTLTDINVNSDDYAEITGKFQLDKANRFEASLAQAVEGYEGSQSGEVKAIKQFASMYRLTAKNSSMVIPLLAFYPAERSNIKLPTAVPEKASDDSTGNRFATLKGAVKGNSTLDDFSELHIQLVNRAEGENTKEVRGLKEQISIAQQMIEDVYEGKELPENDPFTAKLNVKKEELASLIKTMSSTKYQRHLSFVKSAIEAVVPNIKNLEVDRSSGNPRLLVENFGNKVNISQLSLGQKTLVALTGDLARGLVTLNPDADNPLHGHGIIIIDEIELHLHPKWQQGILIRLQTTFPNLQFIVTTHSPQVLSTVDKECIRILRFDDSGLVSIDVPQHQTKGVSSSDVLEQIMGTFSVPLVDEAGWLADYSVLVAENKWNTRGGVSLFDKLIQHFGEGHPEIIKIRGDIRVQEFKQKVRRLRGS